MKTDELRERYLAFFETKGCVRRPSDVLVPRWDPSVLFTPAGMNQFKDHFLGRCKLEFTRATTCQKCLRTGDIENVGRTAYHHTFFEMLGNFSFGDYFKREAINWAWEFLTSKKWLGLDPQRLSATVYLDDDEAADIWARDIKLPPEKIQRLGEDENFWPASAPSQGPDGVCGPCSEIYYHTDFGSVEIWNLVFTQFNRVGAPPNNLRPLPSKNIDTGMGLERTAAALQGVDSNFHIDILQPLVEAAGEVCGLRYNPGDENGRRMRRIADHIRACTMAIHEDVRPGPKKQGYVVRRLLRRAVLDGHQMGVRHPAIYQLVPIVAQLMKTPYPELQETAARVQEVIKSEEEHFLGNLDLGLNRIESLFAEMKRQHRGVISGAEAADMYQTYGFPPELFESIAAEHNLTFDWPGFYDEMARHAKESGAGQVVDVFKTGPIESLKRVVHATQFVGYDSTELEGARVVGIVAKNRLCDQLEEIGQDQPVSIVIDKTPFYGEKGGQVGDTGFLIDGDMRFEVSDTQIDGDLVLHRGHLLAGKITLEETVTAQVNRARRQGIRRAHSATHLLHFALRKHLGEHAVQQGSKVDDDWLRFDFAHNAAPTPEQLAKIEEEVNALILSGDAVTWANMSLADARRCGAMMLFGEKYPDVVRMVAMGDYSKELCGGTHLSNTAEVGYFKIVAEESVAAGTRRITALTGMAAVRQARRERVVLAEIAALLRSPVDEAVARIEGLQKEIRQLKKQAAAGGKTLSVSVESLLANAEKIGGVNVVVAELPPTGPNELRQLIDQLRRKAPPLAAMLACRDEEGAKLTLLAGLSDELTTRKLSAVDWVKAAAAVVGGSGGGRPDMAQAGGKTLERLDEALDVARNAIRRSLDT